MRCASLIREALGVRRIPPFVLVAGTKRGNTAQSKGFARFDSATRSTDPVCRDGRGTPRPPVLSQPEFFSILVAGNEHWVAGQFGFEQGLLIRATG